LIWIENKTMETSLKGKAEYNWPPCTNLFTQLVTIIRRSAVLSLPLQLVFPDLTHSDQFKIIVLDFSYKQIVQMLIAHHSLKTFKKLHVDWMKNLLIFLNLKTYFCCWVHPVNRVYYTTKHCPLHWRCCCWICQGPML
jgi:hypothetical protein